MSSPSQKALLCKITLALLMLDGCVQQDASDIEYTKRIYQHHYVHRGETLDDVAKFYRMSRADLIEINQLKPPYHLAKGRRLHVHKRTFIERGKEVTGDPSLPGHIERDKHNLHLHDAEAYSGGASGLPRSTHVIVKRKGLAKLFLPLVVVGGALAALRPRTAFAAPTLNSGGMPTASSNAMSVKKPIASNSNQFFGGDGAAPIVTRAGLPGSRKSGTAAFFKNTALPLLGLATGGVGLGAALINATLNSKKKPRPVATFQNCCGTKPCFTWPVNNQGRKFVIDKKNKRIKICNTYNERYVRAANGGVIEKIIAPKNTGNLHMYTIVINHSSPYCKSTYKTVYSGLVKIPDALRVGRMVNRDVILGEIKPCCKGSFLFFQILDSGIPVRNTRRYLPGV